MNKNLRKYSKRIWERGHDSDKKSILWQKKSDFREKMSYY